MTTLLDILIGIEKLIFKGTKRAAATSITKRGRNIVVDIFIGFWKYIFLFEGLWLGICFYLYLMLFAALWHILTIPICLLIKLVGLIFGKHLDPDLSPKHLWDMLLKVIKKRSDKPKLKLKEDD